MISSPVRVKQRYELIEQTGERLGIARFKARDLGLSGTDNTPVIVLKQLAPKDEATEVIPY